MEAAKAQACLTAQTPLTVAQRTIHSPGLSLFARSLNEDVNYSSGARFPARQGGCVKYADKGAYNVVRIRFFPQIAALDRLLHQPAEGTVNLAASAFNQTL